MKAAINADHFTGCAGTAIRCEINRRGTYRIERADINAVAATLNAMARQGGTFDEDGAPS